MNDVIRAWKDEDYRAQIGADLSTHPAGTIDLAAASISPVQTTPTATDCPTHTPSCEWVPSNCSICSATTCYEAVDAIVWDEPVLAVV
jgi:mersacidin/lichenicidin family type 2 lantibiotic